MAVGEADEPTFTPEEVQVLAFYAAAAELFGGGAVLQVLRVAGSAAMRVAEAETAVLRINFEVPYLDAGGTDTDVVDGYERLSRMLLPEMDQLFAHLHRLHLSRAARRAWAIDEGNAATLATVAVGFADLAGFTALAGRLSPTELAGVVEAFDQQAGEVVLANGGQVVKLIGDEVMFVADDPADGLLIATTLAHDLPGADDLPGVRVGLAAGQVLNRDGDYCGSVVNLAARLVALAAPGEVLVDEGLAAVAGSDRADALAPVEVKGFDEPVAAFRIGAGEPR